MKDYKHMISRDSKFDDTHYWTFPRRLSVRARPGEFDRGWTVDRIVFVVCCILLALGLLAVNVGAAK